MDNIIIKILRYIILVFIFATSVKSQKIPFYLKASSPEFIQYDSEFEVSLSFRIFDFKADEIVLHVLAPDAVDLLGVKVNGLTKQFKLNSNGKFKRSFDLRFDLKDTQINYDSFLNIILTMNSKKNENTQIDFKLDYVKNNKITRTYGSSDFSKEENILRKVYLNFYKPQTTAGKSLLLKDNSEINFTFNYKKEITNFLIEFWGKFEKPSDKFLSFVNGDRKDTLISLDINSNKFLTSSDVEKINFVKDCFISKNSWYHFSLFIDVNRTQADLYINDDLVLSIDLHNTFAESSFEIIMQKTSEGRIEIDQFKVWEFKNAPQLSLLNKNYENYSADSSRMFVNFSFNDENQVRNFNSTNTEINFKGISFKNSSAPIFSRAPELNVYLYNDFYQIEWENNSGKDADFYELEKSTDGTNYKKIFETFASPEIDKIYYFSDPKNLSDETIYYRVKQINKDRSQVYSASIKIGQSEIRQFKLGQNYPNPFNPQTTISIEMLEAIEVDIYVYDIVGEKVALLNRGILPQGIHTFNFDGSSLPSGIYFCEAKSAKFTEVKKMILAK